MRHNDIIFRAKALKDGSWRTGFFQRISGKAIIIEGGNLFPVDETTLGMSSFYRTQKKGSVEDANIFEGDILEASGRHLIVVFDDGAFRLADRGQYECLKKDEHPFFDDYAELPTLNSLMLSDAPVIAGNIHDVPELI